MADSESRTFFERMREIDRRWVFLVMALAVTVPFFFRVAFKEVVTPEVRAISDLIERFPAGAKVLLPLDFDPPSEPELKPMATSYVRHLCKKKHKIYFMTLWPVGSAEITAMIDEVIEKEFPAYTYGEDYVNLGYKAGNQGPIQGVLNSFQSQYPTDVHNTALSEIPMMRQVKSLKDMDFILNVGAGFPGLKEWIQYGSDPAGVPIAGGVTAVGAPLLYPYYPQQLVGLMGGLKAAAEYESLLMEAFPDDYGDPTQFAGIRRMGPQTLAHLAIIFFIVVGNIAYFATRGSSTSRLKSLEK